MMTSSWEWSRAALVDSADEVCDSAEMVLKVKEPATSLDDVLT